MAFSVAFCDMNKLPMGALDDETAIQSMNDCSRFRNGLYGSLRGLTNGFSVYSTDLQADQFQGVQTNGNRNGIIHGGTFNSSDRDIKSMWASCYTIIASDNYFLEKAALMKENEKLTEEESAELDRYVGEARFIRAFVYYWLADHFCETYSPATAKAEGKGLPIVTKYYPTADATKYPPRSTQDQTYDFIHEDLEAACSALVEYEKTDDSNLAPNAPYLSSNAVLALQARIALLKGEKALAVQKAEAVIHSGKYGLAGIEEVKDMWVNDEAKEVIFRPIMSQVELSSSTGETYLGGGSKKDEADYIPSFETLKLFSDGDCRLGVYFDVWTLKVEGRDVQTFVFHKYPGNEALKTTTEPNYRNMSKPFRLSELYLIIAEASCGTDEAKANKYLNELRGSRIKGYTAKNLTGAELVAEVRLERQRELLGEGFRLSDLRRWGEGFKRGVAHPENPAVEDILSIQGKGLSYKKNDHRYVWPIPSDEIQTNPQMKGQQNPGY